MMGQQLESPAVWPSVQLTGLGEKNIRMCMGEEKEHGKTQTAGASTELEVLSEWNRPKRLVAAYNLT